MQIVFRLLYDLFMENDVSSAQWDQIKAIVLWKHFLP